MNKTSSQFAPTDQPSRCKLLGEKLRALVLLLAALFVALLGQPLELRSQEINFAVPEPYHAISVSAAKILTWPLGDSQIIYLNGNVQIKQSEVSATSDEAILWVQSHSDSQIKRVILYLEGEQVVVRKSRDGNGHIETGHAEDAIVDQRWLGRLFTESGIETSKPPKRLESEPPTILTRALAYHKAQANRKVLRIAMDVQEPNYQTVVNPVTGVVTQISDEPTPTVPDLSEPDIQVPPSEAPDIAPLISPEVESLEATNSGGAKVDIFPRDETQEPNLRIENNPDNPNEQIWIATGGVRVIIRSPDISQLDAFKSDAEKQVVILADNVVGWRSQLPDGGDRWELYLDGNVIFAKDRRVIYAKQMYYDANFQTGTILSADVYTPIQNFRGLVRLKADVVQQSDADNLTAYGAAFTSSRLSFPRYWLQSESIEINRTRTIKTDPVTGYR